MTKDEAERLVALARERWVKGEITKHEYDDLVGSIQAEYYAANSQPQKPRMRPGDDGPSIETRVADRVPSLGKIESGGPDSPLGDGDGPFEASTEVVFGLDATFELISELGQGGFGKVFQARHRLLGQV